MLVIAEGGSCRAAVGFITEGGFEKSDLEELINLMDKNYIGWAEYLAPLVIGASSSAELVGELSGSFCSTDPIVAKTFAKATFFSDHRDLLSQCETKTLILQSESDSLASVSVGQYIDDNMDGREIEVVAAADGFGRAVNVVSGQRQIDGVPNGLGCAGIVVTEPAINRVVVRWFDSEAGLSAI